MNLLYRFLFGLFMILVISGCDQEKGVKRFGIILPQDHQALREIVDGFETTLKATYKGAIQFKVANAQNDINLQRAIIEQMRDQHYDVIVPIGTSVTQMAASMIKTQSIVALAAENPNQYRNKTHFVSNIAFVDDEIDSAEVLAFIHKIYPELKTLTLVHSSTDKIFPEVEQIKQNTKKYGITLHRLMVQNLADLYSAGEAIPQDTQAIFILKDNLIASGISSLIHVANSRKILLMTSDDGTVREGAGMAIGVHERQIGEEGAKLTVQILQGNLAGQLPVIKMRSLTVFVNPPALKLEGQDQKRIVTAAKQLRYAVEEIFPQGRPMEAQQK